MPHTNMQQYLFAELTIQAQNSTHQEMKQRRAIS